MKRFNIIYTTALLSVLFSACSNEEISQTETVDQPLIELTADEYASIAFDHPQEIAQAKLYALIEGFISESSGIAMTRSVQPSQFTIYCKQDIGISEQGRGVTRSAVESNDLPVGRIPCYEILVKNGNDTSFVLASADERAPGILTYFPKFPTSKDKIERALAHPNTRAVLAMSQSQLIADIKDVEKVRAAKRDATVNKVCNLLGIAVKDYKYEDVKHRIGIRNEQGVLTRGNEYYTIPTQVVQARMNIATPLYWDQMEPYNRQLPIATVKYGGLDPKFTNIPAGCSVIALTLLESIIQRSVVNGVSVNWTTLRSQHTLEEGEWATNPAPTATLNMAGNLVKGIYDAIEAQPHTSGGYVTSTIANRENVLNYVKNNFNCSDTIGFDCDQVRLSIANNRPVFVDGLVLGDDGEGTPVGYSIHNFIQVPQVPNLPVLIDKVQQND